jgi:plastocyanin
MAPAVAAAAVMLVVLGGCRVKETPGNAANGKKLFVAKCGSCHTLRRANTNGLTGPNLDAAFAQDRSDGIPSSTIRGLVNAQILHPNREGVMPAKLVTGGDAYDVATYVSQAAAKPGQDTGLLAAIGATAKKKTAAEQNGKLEIPTDPSGQLAYLVSSATAKAGRITINSTNKSTVPHDIAIEGPGANARGRVVANGGTSSISVALTPGTYTFYCSVDAHRQAGMVGKITVK